MSFGAYILNFFETLTPPENIPDDVEILWPYGNPEVKRVMQHFYSSFFNDTGKRIFLIGINPGRFGAGVTGICFTDPIRLAGDCSIDHSIIGGRELSSDFVYRMISAFGGVSAFYQRFYITALSPVGFIRNGKNLNYYDVKGLPTQLDKWMAAVMEKQIAAGANRSVAFCMGQGTNFRYLRDFNERHRFFEQIEPLPHPRWIMQYNRRQLNKFIQLYIDKLYPAG